MLTLSICIPSYNRFHAVQTNLDSILKAKSNHFEVVIVDNCSTEDIRQSLEISDARVRIIKRKTPVYGPRNVGECLGYAQGKYALLCLDKDHVNGEYLDSFIQYLEEHPNVCGGYCLQDWGKPVNIMEPCIYRENTLEKFGYLSKHPSGDFYRMDCLAHLFRDLSNPMFDDSFVFDLMLAECACRGDMLHFTMPLITVEALSESLKIKSFSFTKTRKNLFFQPANRIAQFYKFCVHLDSLHCDRQVSSSVLNALYRRTVVQITLGYRSAMCDERTCIHYSIKPENISIFKMLKWWWRFNRSLLQSDVIPMSRSDRCRAIIENNFNMFARKLRKMFA